VPGNTKACRQSEKRALGITNAHQQMGFGLNFFVNSQLKLFKQRVKEEKKLVVQYFCA
jgi:hypothetical protein